MEKRPTASAGTDARRTGTLIVLVALALALPAVAWALTIEVGGEVYAQKCRPCHADYSETVNDLYVFSHGNHITYQCSACHPEFPHKPEGTLTPVMKDCFACHGLDHGPQGELATGECADCHGEKAGTLRPAGHTAGWAGTPHVAPSEQRLTTECAMCHTQAQCDECHDAEGVEWEPAVAMVYDPGSACLSCHGSPNLIKSGPEGIVSLQVTELGSSAHADVGCPQCHTDFTYAETAQPSKVWSVNAGLSCANPDCHENKDPITQWPASVHGEAVLDGDLESATCGSCHGGHDIARLDTDAAVAALAGSAERMCADCHRDYWDNYNDAYHGAAYKAGADDAPPCWGCHAAHQELASTEPSSSTYAANLAVTCAGSLSGEGCHQHKGASESFVQLSAEQIHQQAAARAANPIQGLLDRVFGGK